MNRSTLAACGLLAFAVLTIFNLLLDAKGLQFANIAAFDRGVAQVRPSLVSTPVVGFFSDQPPGGDEQQEYDLTQYALAPVIVENNVDHAFVIGSIHRPENRLSNPSLELVHDFKNGIQLLRNKTK